MRNHNHFFYILSPSLLVIIALIQIFNSQYNGLSPWKGGGFGMFASIDSPSERILGFYGISAKGDTFKIKISFDEIEYNNDIPRDLLTKLKAFPTLEKLKILIQYLEHLNYVDNNSYYALLNTKNSIKRPKLLQKVARPIKKFESIDDYDPIKFVEIYCSIDKVIFDRSEKKGVLQSFMYISSNGSTHN